MSYSLLASTIDRVEAFKAELARVAESDFPYVDSAEALKSLSSVVEKQLSDLGTLSEQSDMDVVKAMARPVLRDIRDNLPFLGFILRSTNVRNSFEVYGPLSRLAKQLLGENTKLVLSSEWDLSPFIFSNVPHLPGFVLIGLPAQESGNPLLIPLAGHELGHSLWKQKDLGSSLKQELLSAIAKGIRAQWDTFRVLYPKLKNADKATLENTVSVYSFVRPVLDAATKQCEESFCDALGVRLFGVAYLRAFAYLLAPNWSGTRSIRYPNSSARAHALVDAATAYGIHVEPGYAQWFEDLTLPPSPPRVHFELADKAASSLVKKLRGWADEYVRAANIQIATREETARVVASFRRLVPAEKVASLADILDAAWIASGESDFWPKTMGVQQPSRTLSELALKTIEVAEIEKLLTGP